MDAPLAPPSIHSFFLLVICSFIHAGMPLFIHPCMHASIHPSIHPSTHPFSHSFIHRSSVLMHSLIQPTTHPNSTTSSIATKKTT